MICGGIRCDSSNLGQKAINIQFDTFFFKIAHSLNDFCPAIAPRYVLVGHSERRSLYGETDEDCAAKTKVARCGESCEWAKTKVIKRQSN